MLVCVSTSLRPSLSKAKCSQLLSAATGVQDIQHLVYRVACSDITRMVFILGLSDPILVWERLRRQLLLFQPVSKRLKEQYYDSVKLLIVQLSPSKNVLKAGNNLPKPYPEAQILKKIREQACCWMIPHL